MMDKGIFKRVEKKYLINEQQYQSFLEKVSDIARADEYGESSILNIYYDTPDYRLIRTSIEKPIYKEKLRLRSYGTPMDDSKVFIEIKKKYKGIVYKRRVQMSYTEAVSYLNTKSSQKVFMEDKQSTQILNEIEYCRKNYENLAPRMVISYDRIAMIGREDEDLRITVDHNICWRTNQLDLRMQGQETQILEPHQYLLEIKITGAMDLKLAHILNELKIYQTSFSKYGSAYQAMLCTQPLHLYRYTNSVQVSNQKQLAYA